MSATKTGDRARPVYGCEDTKAGGLSLSEPGRDSLLKGFGVRAEGRTTLRVSAWLRLAWFGRAFQGGD